MDRIISPLFVNVSQNNMFILNLNNYRNAHYMVLNKAKIAYKNDIACQLVRLPEYSLVEVLFKLYPETKRLTDIGNVCSIHEKFFMDALVSIGKLTDDNYKYHSKTTYEFGEVDKVNPRVDVFIKELQ